MWVMKVFEAGLRFLGSAPINQQFVAAAQLRRRPSRAHPAGDSWNGRVGWISWPARPPMIVDSPQLCGSTPGLPQSPSTIAGWIQGIIIRLIGESASPSGSAVATAWDQGKIVAQLAGDAKFSGLVSTR